jgi:hypothetical protein
VLRLHRSRRLPVLAVTGLCSLARHLPQAPHDQPGQQRPTQEQSGAPPGEALKVADDAFDPLLVHVIGCPVPALGHLGRDAAGG